MNTSKEPLHKMIDWINLLTYIAIILACGGIWALIAGYLFSNLTVMILSRVALLLSLGCIVMAMILFKRKYYL